MHIEPGLVDSAKLTLSYATATGALGYAAKLALDAIKQDGVAALLQRSAIAALLVFCSFEVLPHAPVGVSELHLILGTSLLLVLGAAPAAIGLAAGLLLQGLFFQPQDLPQFGANVSTLLLPLFACAGLARRLIPAHTAYVDIGYSQALKLSLAYQGGIVAWVAFWAFYGQGFGAAQFASVASFGAAYLSIVMIEPLIDLGLLGLAKRMQGLRASGALNRRLFSAA
jgi:ABC-type Co2+ transport system permease subunit